MNEYIRTYWPIFVTILTLAVTAFTNDAIQTYRISSLEGRQDRQAASIMAVQTTLATQASDAARLAAKIDAISDNVNFIRDRIVKVTN